MKSFISLLLTVVLTFSLTSCGSKENIASTNKTFSDYVGVWSEEDISWEYGGLIIEISVENKEMQIYCALTQSAPASRVAEFTENIKTTDMENNILKLDYSDDGWGSSGKLELTFNKDYIFADFKDIVSDDLAQWGFFEDTYKLVRKDNAYDLLDYDMEDYYELYPEEDMSVPTYDTSKASGILAQKGMTEQEFRESCTPMLGGLWIFNINNERYRYYYVPYGKQYYQENPNDETLQQRINWWNNGTYYKEKYSSLEEYLSDDLYSDKGQDVLFDNTSELFDKMVEYPKDYIGQHFVILSPEGYVYNFIHSSEIYSGYRVSIQDRRDDIYNPNILNDEEYLCYVTFTGSNGLVLNFDLISIEKVSE